MAKKSICEKINIIRSKIVDYPDFPKPGILFKDVFPILQDPPTFKLLNEILLEHVASLSPSIEAVAGLDARGFLFGPLIALHLNIPFIPIRKKGKLPGKIHSYTYKLEYGEDTLEIQETNLAKGTRVLVIDDLIATGGSLTAACHLLNKVGFSIVQCLVIMEIKELNGSSKIPAPVFALINY